MTRKKIRSKTRAKKLWLLHRPPLKGKRKTRVKRNKSTTSKNYRLRNNEVKCTFSHTETPSVACFNDPVNEQRESQVDPRRDFVQLITMSVNRMSTALQCSVNEISGFMNNVASCVYIGAKQVKKVFSFAFKL